MKDLSSLRLSKNMKYTALYWAMNFIETSLDVFTKRYGFTVITIFAEEKYCDINGTLSFKLDTHESFVKLELINRLFCVGYNIDEFDLSEENRIIIKNENLIIDCFNWDYNIDYPYEDRRINYKSRLISGVLEYENKININKAFYDCELFDIKPIKTLNLKNKNQINDSNFEIVDNRVIKYLGNESVVFIPDGIEVLDSCLFWDNQHIEEVVLPQSLKSIGGDTFYNCKNLKKVNIPKYVELMGNNPFAGCPKIEILNESDYFIYKNDALYSKDMQRIIYFSVASNIKEIILPKTLKFIGKHTFYLCDNLEKIILPKSLCHIENNPFAGCSKLSVENHSDSYIIENDVIYDRYKRSVIGALNKIKIKELYLPEGLKTINRNAFWNCKGIETIIFPKSLVDIGYNPFVACSNIKFKNKSPEFKVIDNILYNQDCSKLICYPNWLVQKEVHILESVTSLERGAFAYSPYIETIHLRNVNKINKTCFANCSNLKSIFFSDFLTYIGEWSFAYCKKLKNISVYHQTVVDRNAFSNTNTKINIRNNPSNYLIESDNIYTLKSLEKKYMNAIDVILIDPPYNTNIDYIEYKDGNYEYGYTKFMRERIAQSYKLISKNGFFIITIDDKELENLKKICSEYFDKDLIQVYKWKKRHPLFDFNKIIKNKNKIQQDYEYIIICKKSVDSLLKKINQPFVKDGQINEKQSSMPDIFDCFGTTASAKDELYELFGSRDYFSTPKPKKLIKELLRATTSKNSIILDYFAGSGTTGAATIDLNKEDNGNRTFILINNNENNICQKVTQKRLGKEGIEDFIFMN